MASEDDNYRSDYAFLEGRILRLESEQRAIRRVHGQLADEIEKLTKSVERLRDENEKNLWNEPTDVRNLRRRELDSLRVRAQDAERAEIELTRLKSKFIKQLILLVPTFGALLFTLVELIRTFLHR